MCLSVNVIVNRGIYFKTTDNKWSDGNYIDVLTLVTKAKKSKLNSILIFILKLFELLLLFVCLLNVFLVVSCRSFGQTIRQILRIISKILLEKFQYLFMEINVF